MKKRILKCVLCVLLCVVICLSSVVVVSAVSAFDSPFVKYDNIVITYSTAEFVPSAYPITALDAVLVASEISGVDPFILLQGYSFYKCTQGNYICAEMKSSVFGYVFWRDGDGAFQYFIWKEGEEEDSFSPVPGEVVNDDYSAATVTGKEFKEFCNTYGSTYGPKNTKDYISWRTDARYSGATQMLSSPQMSFFYEGSFCGEQDWLQVYLVPFYTDGVTTYHSAYQLHFYQEVTWKENDDGTKSVDYITMYCDVWNMVDDSEVKTITVTDKIKEYRYMDIGQMTDQYLIWLTPFQSAVDYTNKRRSLVLSPSLAGIVSSSCYLTDYFSSDKTTIADLYYASSDLGKHFRSSVADHDTACDVGDLCDIGYYCSDKPIEMDFSSVDFSQFSDEDTVTLTGDTIYDYTITNKEGDSTTINNYITNNYTYPVTDTGDNGEEGSGTGTDGTGVNGNVTVGGQVDVSGDIDVGGTFDINLNIRTESTLEDGAEQVGGVGDTSAYEYERANVAEALEQIPEVSDGFIGFFTRVFAWLPPPIFELILGGLGLAIVLRIARR